MADASEFVLFSIYMIQIEEGGGVQFNEINKQAIYMY
jgi:hypothetical protein